MTASDKKEHILEIAEELFSENGFDGTSIRHLAQKAGVNVAMIFYYFGSKEKLFEALVEQRTSYMHNMLKQLNENIIDPWERLYAMIDAYVGKIMSNTRFHKILNRQLSLQQHSEMTDNLLNIVLRNAHEMVKIIKDGQEQGQFRKDIDTACVLATLMGTISYVTNSRSFYLKLNEIEGTQSPLSLEELRARLDKHLKELLTNHLRISAAA